jgi:hypothetical protein
MGGVRAFCLILVAVMLLFSVTIPMALAPAIGVNRATLSYTDVLQNGYAQETILVTTDSPDEIGGTYELEGDIAPWIRVDPPGNFTFSGSKPYALTIIVEPPGDARLQQYSGGIRILTGEISRTEGGKIGTSTRAAFLIRIGLGVTGTQLLKCTLGGVQLKDTEIDQPFDFLASVHNAGNVRIRPVFTILVYDQYQTKLVDNITVIEDNDIFPTTTPDILKRVAQQLPPGQYWASVEARAGDQPCDGTAFLTFDVLDRGGVADKGELLRIELNPWTKTGEIVPIAAIFQNQGSRVVSAKFTGTITRQDGNRIYKVIDTDLYNVPPTETARLETFFNPVEPGRYVVAGRVLYNNKLTFQKSAILNVQGPGLEAVSQWGWPLLILFVILILILLILIARRRRRRPVPMPYRRV